MKFGLRNPIRVFGLVLLWRVALLVFTAQPVPANDAFFFDGAVVNWLWHGHYFNPSLAEVFPISGHILYAAYPPLYQGALLIWMKLFGASALSAMAVHLAFFAVSGLLVLVMLRRYFPAVANAVPVVLLFLGITFSDRPESLAHIFGLGALLLLAGNFSGGGWKTLAGAAAALLCGLYTSVIVGAFYFGAGFLAAAVAWLWYRKSVLFVPFLAAATAFAVITFSISKLEPLWWAGFLENARQTPVFTLGFHAPPPVEILKLVRNAPVFLVALVLLPLVFARRERLWQGGGGWLFLSAGIAVMGWVLLGATMTLVTANYVMYLLFVQILLAAGLLALADKVFPKNAHWCRAVIWCCGVLVSVRAVGMTTWGLACGADVGYSRAIQIVSADLNHAPPGATIVLSSAFLYEAARHPQVRALHEAWLAPPRRGHPEDLPGALPRLKPAELILTQFDYYRRYQPVVEGLQAGGKLASIEILNAAHTPPPDAFASFQKIVQHVSWAPVVVRLEWKPGQQR